MHFCARMGCDEEGTKPGELEDNVKLSGRSAINAT